MSEDRVVVITGSSSGLGAAMIKDFAARGFGVCINYIVEGDVEAVYNEVLEVTDESKAMMHQANVADREEVRAMFDAVIDKFGRVDILVNTAGINRDAPFTELTDDNWHAVISAHLHGHFVCSQEYVFHNPDRDGVIINLGASCGQIGRKNGANFCAAKGAIFAFTKCIAQELAPRIRVNCLVPGSVKTREVIERYDLTPDATLEREIAELAIGRLGEIADVTAMFDAILDARFTTGACFHVSGGHFMQ